MANNDAPRSHAALHHGTRTWVLSLILTILCLATIAGTARATSYVMVTDEDLAASADRIVVGKVTGVDQGSNGGFHTDYAVRVQRVLKGDDPGPAVMLRVLGGEGLDGDELDVIGAPRFTVGENAIFFLDEAQDGTYRLHQYLLGAFKQVEQDGGAVALRNLEGAEEVRLPGQRASSEANLARDFEGFAEWLTASASGFESEPDYFFAQPEKGVARIESAYTTIGKDNARWFEFDRGGHVTYFADRTGMHGTAADVFGMVSRALQAWSTVNGAKVNLRYGGATTISKPFAVSDRLNGILWNDPYGEVSGTFDCARGGVLALGGVRRAAGSKSFANGSAAEVVEADIVVNDGAACFFERNSGLDGEEVLAHELGHTLGFGHSNDKAALMHASAKGDGRGCQLGVDDIKGLFYLYPGAPGVTVEPGQLTLELGRYAGAEGESVQISVHRVIGSTGAASVRIRTRNGTAKAPADFTALDQTMTWAHGEAGPKTITIGLAADQLREPAETFKIELLSYDGATAGAIQAAEVTVSDGKAAQQASGGGDVVSLQGASSTVRETDGWVNLTVERTGSGNGPAAVAWRTVDAAAKAGKDYVGGRGVVRWANGDVAPKQVRVQILDIRAAGSDRAFLVRLLRTTGDVKIGAVGATAVKILEAGAR